MTYTAFPHALVETPFGTLEAWATSDRHVGFRTAGNLNVEKKDGEADKFVTINRARYSFRIDFHPHDDPEITKVADYQRLGFDLGLTWQAKVSDASAQKITEKTFGLWADGYATSAAWKKIRSEMVPFLVAWILSDEGQEVIRGGTSASRSNEADRLRTEIADLQAQLAEKTQRLADLQEVMA